MTFNPVVLNFVRKRFKVASPSWRASLVGFTSTDHSHQQLYIRFHVVPTEDKWGACIYWSKGVYQTWDAQSRSSEGFGGWNGSEPDNYSCSGILWFNSCCPRTLWNSTSGRPATCYTLCRPGESNLRAASWLVGVNPDVSRLTLHHILHC